MRCVPPIPIRPVLYNGNQRQGTFGSRNLCLWGTGGSLFGKDEVILDDIVFRCSNATRLLSDGILGLCNNTYLLLAQTSSTKFSYCLGDITDTRHDYSRLIIGKPIKEHLTYEIPLIVDGKYYIDMTAIQIGHVILDIEISFLKRNTTEHEGGMTVDTDSTFSYFPEVVYNPFVVAIRKLIDDLSLDRYYHKPSMLCYKGSFRRDLEEFPIVRFWFGKKVYMEFRTESLFQQLGDGAFCLAFRPIEDLNKNLEFGILGILLQLRYYISYDLRASTFSFQTMDCSAADVEIHDEL